MRIISQDGHYDIPYEQTVLSRGSKAIYADAVNVENIIIASYSSEEKAIKAMKMCREEYLDFETYGSNMFPFESPKVFQFPADDKI